MSGCRGMGAGPGAAATARARTFGPLRAGRPRSRRDAPFPGHASLDEAPSRQPQLVRAKGSGCPKSPRLRRVAGGMRKRLAEFHATSRANARNMGWWQKRGNGAGRAGGERRPQDGKRSPVDPRDKSR